MSAAANSAAYWRIAGMSYLKYANACAEIVRGALKEPHLSKVLLYSLLSLSVRESFDPFSSSPSLSLLTTLSLSLFQKARARDAVYFKATKYVKGSPEAAVITEVIPAERPK
jgi:F-type H+-transporting ATPase subunit epsilon|tara:strand:+ start:1447 stop:1782 length:336 start_codon:yes stop_codon:yes gene_type:complete